MKETIKQILREGLIMEERIKFSMNIPDDIMKIKDVFKKNGYKLYVVGGAVRDALLGKTPKDFDLATDAVPDKVEEMMKTAGLKTLPTGKSFGVINVFTSEGEYEIATFRSDEYKDNESTSINDNPNLEFIGQMVGNKFVKGDKPKKNIGGRRPDGVTFTNIEGDVKRRDLTINALFYDIDTFEIVDLVGGVQDLKNGVVRTVGAPEDRFGEDRLRILRAIRFAGRFGSELDPATDAALQKDGSLEGISGERIRDEFLKGMTSAKDLKQYLQMLDKYKLFDFIFKGLKVNKNFINDKDVIIDLADLLKENNLDTLGKKLNELKYTAEEIKAVKFLIAMLKLDIDTAVTLKKAQEHAGVTPEQIKNFCKREGISGDLLNAFLKFNLSVSGPEAMDKFNLKPGKELGQAIQKMETDKFKKLL